MSVNDILRIKVKGETCIPSGTYKVDYTYSPRFKKKMPLVCNVKGFDGIRFHTGNTDKDSEGCILVGLNKIKGKLIDSRITYHQFDLIIQNAINLNQSIELTIE